MTVQLPEKIWAGSPAAMTMGELVSGHQNPQEFPEFSNPLGKPTLCGFVIPDFQRPLVWTESQEIAFIQSIWRGIPIGSYAVNDVFPYDGYPPHLCNILIDGQQRLNTIAKYLDDKIEVYGGKWSDLTERQRRRFNNTHFTRMRVQSKDEQYLRDYYNLMNFGGTQHDASQVA